MTHFVQNELKQNWPQHIKSILDKRLKCTWSTALSQIRPFYLLRRRCLLFSPLLFSFLYIKSLLRMIWHYSHLEDKAQANKMGEKKVNWILIVILFSFYRRNYLRYQLSLHCDVSLHELLNYIYNRWLVNDYKFICFGCVSLFFLFLFVDKVFSETWILPRPGEMDKINEEFWKSSKHWK